MNHGWERYGWNKEEPVITSLIIAAVAFAGLFILFLVISKSMNMIYAQLNRLHYLLQREYDYYQELVEVRRAMPSEEDEEEEPENDQS